MPWIYKDNEPQWCPDRNGIFHFVFDIDSPNFDDPEFYQCICGSVDLDDSFFSPSQFPASTHCSACCSLMSAFETLVLGLTAHK
jgi:hypothetical protein